MSVPLWVFLLVLGWAILVTIFHFFRNPLPFPDRGHRCFAVPSEQAARAVLEVLQYIGGLPERFTFDAVSTHQTLLWDNATIIIRHDKDLRAQGIEPNSLSLVVSDPEESAIEAGAILVGSRFKFEATVHSVPEMEGKLWLLTSNAFDGWTMIFRRSLIAMGNPPNKHKLLS